MSVAVAGRTDAPSPAVAPPPGNPRFALFDSLRALAVLGILTMHVNDLSGAGATLEDRTASVLGSQAPLLFFVISGFLLYRPFVAARAEGRPRPGIGRYARRRVLRIVPAYWVALTLLSIFPGVVGVFSSDWWRYYLFLQVYSDRTTGGGIPVAWTLCVEVAFYVALPFVALAAERLRLGARGQLALLGLIAAGGIAVQIAAGRRTISHLVATGLPGQSTWLAVGMALAVVSVAVEGRRDHPRVVRFVRARPGLCWAGALAAFCGLVALEPGHGVLGVFAQLQEVQPYWKMLARIALIAVFNVLLVAPALFAEGAGGLPRRVLALRPLVWLGVVSYAFYVYHLTIAELIALDRDPNHFSGHGLGLLDHLHAVRAPVLFVLTFAAAAALAAVSYRFVELPFLRRKEPGAR